jgi:hypothetical protein
MVLELEGSLNDVRFEAVVARSSDRSNSCLCEDTGINSVAASYAMASSASPPSGSRSRSVLSRQSAPRAVRADQPHVGRPHPLDVGARAGDLLHGT